MQQFLQGKSHAEELRRSTHEAPHTQTELDAVGTNAAIVELYQSLGTLNPSGAKEGTARSVL